MNPQKKLKELLRSRKNNNWWAASEAYYTLVTLSSIFYWSASIWKYPQKIGKGKGYIQTSMCTYVDVGNRPLRQSYLHPRPGRKSQSDHRLILIWDSSHLGDLDCPSELSTDPCAPASNWQLLALAYCQKMYKKKKTFKSVYWRRRDINGRNFKALQNRPMHWSISRC